MTREINVINDLAQEDGTVLNQTTDIILENNPAEDTMEIPEEIKKRMDFHNNRMKRYVYMKDVFDSLKVAFNTGKNLVLFGPGGHAKSEGIIDFLGSKGINPFVLSMGSGMNTDRLYGGTDLRHFIGEGADGKLEYLVENSFMNNEVVVFEELFDAPDFILEQLKDILSSKVFRNGNQIFPIKTKLIICATNKTREDFHKGNASLKALLERFPLECEVKWKDYNKTTYTNLLESTIGYADPLLVFILEEFAKSNKNISPRIAITSAELLAECGPNCLKFIAEFNSDEKLLTEIVSKYENIQKFQDKLTYINKEILASLDILNIDDPAVTDFTLKNFKLLNNKLKVEISAIDKLKILDQMIPVRKQFVDKCTVLYTTNVNKLRVIEELNKLED